MRIGKALKAIFQSGHKSYTTSLSTKANDNSDMYNNLSIEI